MSRRELYLDEQSRGEREVDNRLHFAGSSRQLSFYSRFFLNCWKPRRNGALQPAILCIGTLNNTRQEGPSETASPSGNQKLSYYELQWRITNLGSVLVGRDILSSLQRRRNWSLSHLQRTHTEVASDRTLLCNFLDGSGHTICLCVAFPASSSWHIFQTHTHTSAHVHTSD